MLMTSKICQNITCPLTLSTAKPKPCIGSKCGSWRLYVIGNGEYPTVDGAPVAYCGQAGPPHLEQLYLQWPALLSDAARFAFDSSRLRRQRTQDGSEGQI